MEHIIVRPGSIVVTDFGAYQHWSLVSDFVCQAGPPMLISATSRNGTVKEETWDDATQGKKTYVANISLAKPLHDVLAHARSQIDEWKYSVASNNCEHFVKWACGLEVSSTQIRAGVGGAVTGVAFVAAISKKPKAIKFLGGAILIGGLAVWATKALEKPNTRISIDV